MKRLLYGVLIACFVFAAVSYGADAPIKVVKVTIPDVNISKDAEGITKVTIPNGKVTSDVAMPEVPYYITKVIYPKGYKIIKIDLMEQTDEQTFPKIILPIVGNEKEPKKTSGTYPSKKFDWKDYKSGSGYAELEIYPFSYEIVTQTGKLYKNYQFAVDYSTSPVEISKVSPDKPKYYPNDKVKVAVDVNNPGPSQNVNVNVSLISNETNKKVDEFTVPKPEKIDNNKKKVITVEGPIENVPAGDYHVEVTVSDDQGKILDTEVSYITIYYPKIELTSLEVTPKKFKLGDKIMFTLNVKNTGNVDIDAAKAIFQVMADKDVLEENAEMFPALKAGATATISSSWNSSVAKTGSLYHVVAYVLFDQWKTEDLKEVFSTNAMPTAKFSYTPSDPKVGTEIKFDASMSTDEDGKIVKYKWDFGDNSDYAPTTSVVTYKYNTYGVFNVTLTIDDNENGTGTTSKIITIKKPQTQTQKSQND